MTRAMVFAKECIRSGTIASLVMIPPGLLFKAMELRVGHYGPKLGALLFGDPSPWLLFAQHMVIGWVSAAPLLLWLGSARVSSPVVAGTIYGLVYYVLVNALGLPLAFGDPMPWQLGWHYVYPSLVVHLVYGASLGFTTRRFARMAHGIVPATISPKP